MSTNTKLVREVTRNCENPECGKPYRVTKFTQRYCSKACYRKGSNREQYAKRAADPESKAKLLADQRAWYDENRAAEKERSREKYQRIRASVLAHYGGACDCCGEARVEFLGLDHVEGGGRAHRQTFGGPLATWLHKNGYPEGFRVLCHNCNQALGAYGYCPHRRA